MLPKYLSIENTICLELPFPVTDNIRILDIDQLKQDWGFKFIYHIFGFFNNNMDWINLAPSYKEGKFKIHEESITKIYITGRSNSKEPSIKHIKINNTYKDEMLLKAHYVDYYLLICDGYCNTASALIPFTLRDAFLQKIVRYANTEHDKAFAFNQLNFAMQSSKGRLLQGTCPKSLNVYLKQKLYTVPDVLYILMEDANARFYPFHPYAPFDWPEEYRLSDNYIFHGYENKTIPFSRLTWDAFYMDLYADDLIEGKVYFNRISEEYKQYNLPAAIETFIHRRFYFIHYSAVCYRKLYIEISGKTKNKLKNIAIFEDYYGDYLDMSLLGLYTGDFYGDYLDMSLLGPYKDLYEEEYEIYRQFLVAKYYKESIDTKSETVVNFENLYDSLTNDQKLFLLKNRVTRDGFFFNNSFWENDKKCYATITMEKRKWLENFLYFLGDPHIKHCYLTFEQIESCLDYIKKNYEFSFCCSSPSSYLERNMTIEMAAIEQFVRMNKRKIEISYASMKNTYHKLLVDSHSLSNVFENNLSITPSSKDGGL